MQTIAPLSPLPAITGPVLIDGESQPGYSGTPLIEIDGSEAGGGDGLLITGPDVAVRGLDIDNFSQGAGIHITGTGATGDWVYGNDLGTDPTGTQAEPNEYGVEIDGNAADDVIGTDGDGNESQQANRISGNSMSGVELRGSDQTVGFASSSADIPQLLTLNGSAVVQGGALQLTDQSARDPAGSAFTSTPVDIDQFSTQFQFQFQDHYAFEFNDGLTFTIQGQGPTALGAGGDSLGYQGIGRSFAVKFEASDNSDGASDVTGLYADGASPTVPETSLNSTGIQPGQHRRVAGGHVLQRHDPLCDHHRHHAAGIRRRSPTRWTSRARSEARTPMSDSRRPRPGSA